MTKSPIDPACFFCDARPAPMTVIGRAKWEEIDGRSEPVGCHYQPACRGCAKKPALELIRMAMDRAAKGGPPAERE